MNVPNRNFLPLMLNMPNPKVLEVGVEFGGYTDKYYDWITKMGGRIWLLDLWQTEGNDDYFSKREGQVEKGYKQIKKKYANKENVTLVKGNAFKKHEDFEDDFFDWIYIDCDHTYEGISKNIEIWLPKLRGGGMFSGHDYDPDPDNEFFEHMQINRAVNKSFGKRGFELTGEKFYKSWFFFK